MSKVNKRWDKWIYSSVSKFFFDAAALEGAFMHIEGQKRETSGKSEWLEFRLDGPWYNELSHNCWRVEVEINIGVNHTMDDSNFHGLSLLKGVAESLFENCIVVSKNATKDVADAESNGSRFIVLSLQNMDSANRLIATNFGNPKPSEDIEQATIEGRYMQTFSLTP